MKEAVNEKGPRVWRRLRSRPLLKTLYNAAPWYLQNVMVSLNGLLLLRHATGKEVQGYLDQLMESQWLPKDALADIQAKKLRLLIEHAYNNVPYYHQIFNDSGLKPRDIREPSDLQKLPMLSKQDVRQNLDRLIAKDFGRGKVRYTTTGGTTGTPLPVYATEANVSTERALSLRMRSWAGWAPGESRATFNGMMVVPMESQNLPLWRHDLPERRLFFSVFHMTRQNIDQYLRRLKAFRPKIIEGYPSYLRLLALRLEREGETFPVHAVFTYTEPLYADQRRIIEDRFGCKVFDWYGLTEGVASAGQCELTDGYHVSAEKTIVEIVKPGGENAQNGEYGEIVGTNLEEYYLPLIRYRTGDMSAYREQPCSCGRGLPLIEQIQTRVEAFLITPDGRLIKNCAALESFLGVNSVQKSQIIQEARDQIVVKLVPTESYSRVDRDRIVEGFATILGPEMEISVELVEDIPLTATGKHPFVISKVHVEV